jgi:hypothetical protein
LGGIALILACDALLRRLTPNGRLRRLTLFLVAFSSGLGWLMLPLGQLLSTDLTVPESNTFLTLMDNAHFPLGMAALILYWSCLLASTREPRGRLLAVAGAAGLSLVLLVLLQPFMIALVLAASALYLLLRVLRDQRLDTALAARTGVSAAMALPIASFITLTMWRDPLGRVWLEQNLNLSPPVQYFLSGYGILIPAVLFGVALALKERTNGDLLLIGWLTATLVAIYAPVPFQRRYAFGLHLVVAILAGKGIVEGLLPRLQARRRRPAARIFALATFPTSLAVMTLFTAGALTHSPVLFLTNGESQAMQWIREAGHDGAVVLSSPELGVILPAVTDQRAVCGNAFTTPDAALVEARVRGFFSPEASHQERRGALEDWGAAYVLLGPRERDLGIEHLTPGDGVRAWLRFGDTILYLTRAH